MLILELGFALRGSNFCAKGSVAIDQIFLGAKFPGDATY